MNIQAIIVLIIIIGIYIVGILLNIFISLILIKGIIFELTNNETLSNLCSWLVFVILGIICSIIYITFLIVIIAALKEE